MLLDTRLREQVRASLASFEVRRLASASHRAAAVVLALIEEGTGANVNGIAQPSGWSREAAFLLTRRSTGLSSHGGQWALPGGRIEPGETAEAAALREMSEEVGLHLTPDDILGTLDDFVSRSGYAITPVVAWAGAAADLAPNAAEVASLHRIPLTEFLRPDSPLLEPSEDPGREILRMPVGERWIAAPTGAFLYQFREVCIAGRVTRVAHYDQPVFARK